MTPIKNLYFVLAFFVASCNPSWSQDTAQSALTSGAEVLQALDSQIAPVMQAAVEEADSLHADREGYLRALEPWAHVASAVSLTRQSFFAAQRGLDVWRLGDGGQWIDASACLLVGLLELEAVLPAVNVEVPAEVHNWLSLFRQFAIGSCRR